MAFNRQCNLSGFTPNLRGGSNSIPQSNLTGQIGGKSIEIMTTKFDQACNVIHCLLKALDLSGFTPNLRGVKFYPPQSNSAGQIGGKSIEIMTTKFDQACNVIHCLLEALDLNGFTPNLRGGQILSPRSNLTGHNLNGFTPNSTRH